MGLAIESSGLIKRFGAQTAVAGVDLAVPEGAVYGFMGQNGAGKTTTIRLILGLMAPSGGTVRVFGADVAKNRRAAVIRVGSMVETPSFYERLTGRENLDITRRLIGAPRADIDRVLEIVDLKDAADRLVGGYSLGMRQRLGVARALVGRPRLLVLDEPSNGLDPNGILEMRGLIRALPAREGVTLFVSSHLLSEVEQMASHVGLMHRGRLLEQTTLAALKASRPRVLEVGADDPARARLLAEAHGFMVLDGAGLRIRLREHDDGAVAALNRLLVGEGIGVSRLTVEEPSLEAVYLERTGANPRPRELAA